MTRLLLVALIAAAVCVVSAGVGAAVDASVTITDATTWLPKSMSHSYYSPGLEIGYNGLQTKSYTLKMWLLERTNWNCASSQVCEKTITIDNTAGDNSSGTIYIKEVIDMYNYNTFDWVVRLYDGGTEVSYAERYATGTSNRPPQLAQIDDKTAFKNSYLEFIISGNDPESDGLTYSTNNLPAGASFDSSNRTFSWTPTTTGNYSNIRFRVTDDGEGNLYDSEYITITVLEPEPQLSITPCSLDFGSKATSFTFNVTNTGEGTLEWVVTDDQDWITVSPTSGSTTSEADVITVTVDRIGLASGSYSGTVNITSNAGNQDISISMTVMELPPVKGVCYGPFRDGQNPNWGPYPSENEIREDMSILKSTWAISIRTYGVSNGLDKIIPLANEFYLNVSAGAWLGSNLTSNEEEVNTLTDLAQNHDIETVIVGNEVVLSYECEWDTLTKAELIEYITRVKENVSVPVSTGEPWHIWNNDTNSDLVDAVDYILIHVHPYWEGIPIDNASDYVIDRCKEIQNKYPHKEVVIGEAGWPSDGSPNGEAVPSLENQKRFMEELLDLADEEGIRLYYFEAFDEKWKEEYDVGPHWGLYYSNRACKHPSKGDLNSDGTLTPADAAIALEIAVSSRPCDAAMFAVADVSGDNRVTSLDVFMILQAAAGSISL